MEFTKNNSRRTLVPWSAPIVVGHCCGVALVTGSQNPTRLSQICASVTDSDQSGAGGRTRDACERDSSDWPEV
jgi:hypothetical protein